MFWHLGSIFELSPLDLMWGGCLRLFVSSKLWSLVLTSAILEALSVRRCWGKRIVCKHRSYLDTEYKLGGFKHFSSLNPGNNVGRIPNSTHIFSNWVAQSSPSNVEIASLDHCWLETWGAFTHWANVMKMATGLMILLMLMGKQSADHRKDVRNPV